MSNPKEQLQPPLEMAFVVSPFESATISNIDFDEAALVDGVHGVFTSADVPGKNNVICSLGHFPLFAEGDAAFIGHLVAVVVAERASIARAGADLVRVDYKPKPPVLEIEEALKLNSFHDGSNELVDEGSFVGESDELESIERNFVFPDHVCVQELGRVEANVIGSGQLSVDVDACESLVLASSIAALTGVNEEEVKVTCGRETKFSDGRFSRLFFFAGLTALCSLKTRRGVRFRPSDAPNEMLSSRSGQIQATIEVTHDSSGIIKSLGCNVNVDSGSAVGLSNDFRDSLMGHFNGVYSCADLRLKCSLCRTNGSPSLVHGVDGVALGSFISEELNTQISSRTGAQVHSLRRINFSHFMEHEDDEVLRSRHKIIVDAWARLIEDSSYKERREEIERFNESDPNYKRGIAAVPVRVGSGTEENSEEFSFGSAVAEVQVDAFTGELFLVRIDALQLSQAGLGSAEQVSRMSASFLDGMRNYFFLGCGGTYHEFNNSILLGSGAVPADLRFELMEHDKKSVRFSSSVSYCLSMSVYQATREALRQYRKSLSFVDLPLILSPEIIYNAIHGSDS